jgi:hypothetical protein
VNITFMDRCMSSSGDWITTALFRSGLFGKAVPTQLPPPIAVDFRVEQIPDSIERQP